MVAEEDVAVGTVQCGRQRLLAHRRIRAVPLELLEGGDHDGHRLGRSPSP
ncbi:MULTISPECIES: hypothetical protein [Streptomyces]|nr:MULTISPECIES: hypothetical protein [Streptomyces]MBK3522759.1 hypothetical protein [Streptomyces sp. MBT70]